MGRRKTIDDEEILRRAAEVFRRSGHTASTRDVARAAGISQAVLYQRFGSKQDLFFKAMTPAPPDVQALLGPYPPRSVRADLARIAERLAAYLGALLPTLLHVLAHPGLGHDRLMVWHQGLPFEPLLAALTDRFTRLQQDGLASRTDPAAAARAFLAAVHSVAVVQTMTHHGPPHGTQPDTESLVEVLWVGLAPAATRAKPPAQRRQRTRGASSAR
jgi:AcrR family transcriptional regulator